MSVTNPEPQLYPEAPEPVTARRIGDETVIPLDTGFALVASRSKPDVWHVVEAGRCDCPAYRFRETCRHLATAAQALAEAFPAPALDDAGAERLFAKLDERAGRRPCHRCGAPARAPIDGATPTCGVCAKALITLADD